MKKAHFGLLAFALCLTPVGQADTIYTFSMNTTPLVGNGPFALDLQFLDGSGSGDDNNTVALTDFTFGAGGSPSGGGTATGGASGSLASGVTLRDTQFFNEYFENFTPGTLLSFTIDTTNVADPGGTPDLFTVAILDSHGNELPTIGPASEFLDVSLAGGANPQVSTYGSAPGSAFSLAAPIVQPQSPATVPEPSSFGELIAVFLAGGVWHTVVKPRRPAAKAKIR
jgi:hypothetical protein